MEEEKIKQFQELLRIHFRNPTLLQDALTHPSSHEGRDAPAHRQFERMELFGDALLNLVITEQLLKIYPDLDEGQLSKFRSTLVSREALFNVIASRIHLHDFTIVGSGEDSKTPREKAKILADVSEALFAAIYYDQGLEAVRRFILRHYIPHLSRQSIDEISFNAKGVLQEEVQKRTQRLPEYTFERKGNVFLCRVGADPLGSAEGEGASKKIAAQKAATAFLKIIEPKLVPQDAGEVKPTVTTASAESSEVKPAVPVENAETSLPQPHHERPAFRPRHRTFRPRSHHPRRPPFKTESSSTSAETTHAPGPATEDHSGDTHPHKPAGDHHVSATGPTHDRPRERPHYNRRRDTHPGASRSHSHPRSEKRRDVTPGQRLGHRQDQVDWRTWQSSLDEKIAPPSPDSEETKKKLSLKDHLKKLTGRMRSKK